MSLRLIFLTHQLEEIDRVQIHKLFNEMMFSVEPLYEKKRVSSFVNVRRVLGLDKRVAYDSGGFAFLIGRIKKLPDPHKTCIIYKLLGFTDNDFLIQLDLPPQYYMSKEERIELIKKSAEYYWIMVNELKTDKLLGVVHGWTEDELKLSLELLEDPDRLAVGCNFSTMKPYVHGYIGKRRKCVAIGSYNVKTVLPERLIATHSGSAEKVLQRVPRDVVYERLCTAMNMLRDREVFILGGSNPNTAHLLFLIGARYIDGASWRLAGKLWRIYVPELGEFSVGRKRISKRLNDEAIKVMKEYYKESPFSDMPFEEFMKRISANSGGFIFRALWNAYVLKIEERIANEYANDPDRYYKYLRKRWSNNSYWKHTLDFVWKRMKKAYVQEKMDIYLKIK